MKTENQIVSAAVLGTMAFKAGLPRVPVKDTRLTRILAGKKTGENIPILRAWIESWDAANLVANVGNICDNV